jgi:hypothetical protein
LAAANPKSNGMPNMAMITENTGVVRSREPEGKTKTLIAWNKKNEINNLCRTIIYGTRHKVKVAMG